MKQISVVVPVYNAESTLYRLFDSLDRQTVKDFEVIFVNDASTDGSLRILHDYQKTATFAYSVVPLNKNSGAGNARNIGMRSAISPYFAFIDSDDYISDNYFEKLLTTAQSSNADIVIASCLKAWSNARTKPQYDVNKYRKHLGNTEYLACMLDIGPCGKIFRRELWDEKLTKFPIELRAEDIAVIPVLYNRAKTFDTASEAIYFYMQTENSRSRAHGKYYDDIFQCCKILEQRLDNTRVIEFRCVSSIGYGVEMNALRYGVAHNEVLQYSDYLRKNYPTGYRNRYLRTLVFQKRIFIIFAYLRQYKLMKLMVKIAK